MTWRTPAVVLAALTLVLSGCTPPPFEPQGEPATAAREQLRPRLADLLSQVTQGEPTLATATLDGCTTGQNNWKVKNTWHHECSLVAAVVFPGAATRDDVAGALGEMSDRLEHLGCTPSGSLTLDRVAEAYWDKYSSDPGREYHPGMLPSVRHGCGDLTLEVDYLDPVTFDADNDGDWPSWPWFDDEFETTVASDDLVRQVSTEGSAMFWSIMVWAPYYQVPF